MCLRVPGRFCCTAAGYVVTAPCILQLDAHKSTQEIAIKSWLAWPTLSSEQLDCGPVIISICSIGQKHYALCLLTLALVLSTTIETLQPDRLSCNAADRNHPSKFQAQGRRSGKRMKDQMDVLRQASRQNACTNALVGQTEV